MAENLNMCNISTLLRALDPDNSRERSFKLPETSNLIPYKVTKDRKKRHFPK